MIYRYLNHHYILERSIVFIVDQDFDTEIEKKRASNYLIQFFDSLQPTDKFGFISLSVS